MKGKLYTLLAVVLLLSMVLAACAPQAAPTTVATEAPATEAPVVTEAPATEAPVATEAPTEEPAATEPAATEAPTAEAGTGYNVMSMSAPDCDYGGNFKTIESVDEFTVRFTMCAPEPAFLSKIAFTSFAIEPSEYLSSTQGGGEGSALLEKPIGTGPYKVSEWKRGDELVFTRNDDYWGEKAKTPTVVFRWSSEAAQRLLELQAGTVDGIDNPGPDDFATIEGDSSLKLVPREALNIFYVGFNNTSPPFDNEKVRQAIAMGIDRQRIVDNFFPAGSSVATHFTPCAIPNACTGDEWYTFDAEAAKALLAEAGFPDGFQTKIFYRDVVRGYLPQPGVVAQDIQAQLKENLNIDAQIEVMESGAFLEAADAGTLNGIHLLGWGADYPDMTNFLDYHFGGGASKQFGTHFDDIVEALKQGAALADDAAREPFYVTANNLIKQHVPMVPIAHGGSAVAYKATVEGAHSSPLGNENMAVMSVPDQDTFVWMQNAEPISLYCADETDGESLRACEQVTESLYGYELAGTAAEPRLAEKCEPNEDLTVWTCTLRKGVKFHDGSDLDANDVVMSMLVQWDAANPLHKGNTGAFSYFSGLWGGFLNPPPAQ
jgi:ABC-type transport system substrate-binding protein